MTKPTEPLRAEHRDLFPHVAELRTVAHAISHWDADTSERITSTVTFLRDHLVAHARAEEAVLYPTLERLQGAPGATATMVADHVEIVARIDTLVTLVGPFTRRSPSEREANNLRAQLYGLEAILQLHFGKEEDVLLPVLDAHLSDADIVALFEQMGAVDHPAVSVG
jgi:iron-sulfur cluster repair protein YtfE (RIC family)